MSSPFASVRRSGNRAFWIPAGAEPKTLSSRLESSGGQLEEGTASGGEGRVPCRGLFPRVGFIVTNLTAASLRGGPVLQQARNGGIMDHGSTQALKVTRFSSHCFRADEVHLWLSLIAYTLGNLQRRLALPKAIGTWALTGLQHRLVKVDGRLI